MTICASKLTAENELERAADDGLAPSTGAGLADGYTPLSHRWVAGWWDGRGGGGRGGEVVEVGGGESVYEVEWELLTIE